MTVEATGARTGPSGFWIQDSGLTCHRSTSRVYQPPSLVILPFLTAFGESHDLGFEAHVGFCRDLNAMKPPHAITRAIHDFYRNHTSLPLNPPLFTENNSSRRDRHIVPPHLQNRLPAVCYPPPCRPPACALPLPHAIHATPPQPFFNVPAPVTISLNGHHG